MQRPNLHLAKPSNLHHAALLGPTRLFKTRLGVIFSAHAIPAIRSFMEANCIAYFERVQNFGAFIMQ
jgi:hypothetical protein